MGRFKIEDTVSAINVPGQGMPADWPTVFPKPAIGLELDGVIVEDIGTPLLTPSMVQFIPGSLEAIRSLRLKGYKVMIITDQPGISKGIQTKQQVDEVLQYLMQVFGQAGIMSIDGMLYSTSDLKDDIYAKPNDGMYRRATSENKITWLNGWVVGHQSKDAKAAAKIGATPVILKTGKWEEAMKIISMHANKDIKNKTQVFNNLLDFSKSLP